MQLIISGRNERERRERDKVRERRRKVEARNFRDRYPIKGVPPPPSPTLLHQQTKGHIEESTGSQISVLI